MTNFFAGHSHPALNFRTMIAGSANQPGPQSGQIRWQDEHADDVGRQFLPQLPVPLPVDVEHHVAAFGQRFLHRRPGRSIRVRALQHPGPFQQRVIPQRLLELRFSQEVIMNAVDLLRPPSARCHADRPFQQRLGRQQRFGDRGLTSPGRSR